MKHLVVAGLLLAVLAAGRVDAQTCNGLPIRGRGAVAASYLRGDAAETPLELAQYGGAAVVQIPGWSPFHTRHAVRVEARYGDATAEQRQNGTLVTRFPGHQYGAAAGYTVDVLPQSYVGDYVICLNAGADASHWEIDGQSGTVFTIPAGLTFGVDLHGATVGVAPHAGFGAFWHHAAGDTPLGRVERSGVKPWGEGGVGVTVGPMHADASVRHEFKVSRRARFTMGWFF
ncbi:MAG: hypothetical protein IRZ00_17970 [Gemmatimonadetes bacterium]|nr:hypothetical protein [Gemmatimonadota bacterium]